jgi:hypothetical protein
MVVVGLVVVAALAGVGAIAWSTRPDPQEKFCTLALAVAPTPPELAPLLDPGESLVFEDQGAPGDDGCAIQFWGPPSGPVVRADDCVIEYPPDWTEERPVQRIEPINPDGTCWREG